MTDDLLLYVGTVEQAEAEKDGEVTLWGANPEAITELAYAGWLGKAAPQLPTPGVCATHENPDLWFSDVPEERVKAVALCGECPARLACLAQAVANGEVDGIWGGVAFDGKPTELPKPCHEGPEDWGFRKNGHRYCKACLRAQAKARRAAKKAVA